MNAPLPSTAPAEILFLPEGTHRIHAHADGQPARPVVRVSAAEGEAIAGKLQRDLARLQSRNVRPWLDFGHQGGTASALPVAFRYEPGQGVMLAVEWTDAGRRAIHGRDYSYFSPVFFMGEDGAPDGLPDHGAIGALVNEPAFRDIPRISVACADPVADGPAEQPAAADGPGETDGTPAAGQASAVEEHGGIELAVRTQPALHPHHLAALEK